MDGGFYVRGYAGRRHRLPKMTTQASKKTRLAAWIIYKHPSDFPDKFVARKFVLNKPTPQVIIANSAGDIRNFLLETIPAKILTRYERIETDSPAILETWVLEI